MRGVESDNDRLRLRKCSNKFGIPLGLHYLCSSKVTNINNTT